MIWTKDTHRSAKFQTFNYSYEISPSLHFDKLLFLKVYKISAKKVQRSCVSWHWRVMRNLKKNWSVVSKMTRIWEILTRALKSLKNLHFHWFLLWKVFIVWPKKVQRSYLSWHWRVMQNLKKNWLVVWKMTWEIWQIFTRALEESLQNLHLDWFLLCKVNNMLGSNIIKFLMSFQNWHKKFDDVWPKHLIVSKICPLMSSFSPKYIMFERKKYRGVIFHETSEWCKIWQKTDCGLENDMRNLANFHQSTWKFQNWDISSFHPK